MFFLYYVYKKTDSGARRVGSSYIWIETMMVRGFCVIKMKPPLRVIACQELSPRCLHGWKPPAYGHEIDFNVTSARVFVSASRERGLRIWILNIVDSSARLVTNSHPVPPLTCAVPFWVGIKACRYDCCQLSDKFCKPLMLYSLELGKLSYESFLQPVEVGVLNCHRHTKCNFKVG